MPGKVTLGYFLSIVTNLKFEELISLISIKKIEYMDFKNRMQLHVTFYFNSCKVMASKKTKQNNETWKSVNCVLLCRMNHVALQQWN